jgi:V/A-type H+-transporting ATPase subunit C
VDTSVHYILHDRIINELPIDIILNANSLDEIAGVCAGTPYGQIIRQYSHTVESDESLFRFEIALDHSYYENLKTAIQRLDGGDQAIALRLMGVEIDLQNISWIMRFKNFYDLPLETVLATIIPGGFNFSKTVISALYRTQNITSLLQGFVKGKYPGLSALCDSQTSDSSSRLLLIQRILTEIKRHEVKRILSGYPFTIGIILAYFLLKKDELQKIRLLLNAKQYGEPQERIESML